MSRPLRHLNGLRAFEAAARHLSFKKAARELNVTPAAVSSQIRLLEQRLNQPLFHRHGRQISLTAAGRKLLPGVPIGPFDFQGTRRDDPNDIFPHEDRRELRGLRIFDSWLNHNDSDSVNSLDMFYTDDNGASYVMHHRLDLTVFAEQRIRLVARGRFKAPDFGTR